MTAVSWLEQEFIKLEATIGVHGKMYELIEQAKEMEREQQERVVNMALLNTTSSQTEISDEEIENCVGDGMHDFYKGGFIEGAKWYREHLKQR